MPVLKLLPKINKKTACFNRYLHMKNYLEGKSKEPENKVKSLECFRLSLHKYCMIQYDGPFISMFMGF